MSDASWLMVATGLSLVGMAWLALAMDVHWGQVMHRQARAFAGSRPLLRILGASALMLSLMASLKADRPSMAVLVWVMLMAGAAVTVAMVLARRPQVLGWLWPVGQRSSGR